jgi:tripartite-type tricarboxylate transporter receptor subunit TctC
MLHLVRFAGLTAVFIFCLTSSAAALDDTAVVKFVVPYAPGGFPDTISRLVANQLAIEGSMKFAIENRPGGAGTVAAEYVANSDPDGTTLLVADAQQWAIAPAMLKSVRYNVLRDFAPVTLLGTTFNVLVVSAALGVADFPGLVALLKANPGKYNYGTPGIGTIHHLTMEALRNRLTLKITQVPYKGGSEVIPALLAGNVQLAVQALPAVGSLSKEGRLKILAMVTAKRSALAPEIPAIEEFGVPDMDFPGAIGILAPTKTPPATIARLAKAMTAAASAPDVVAKLATYAIEPSHLTPEEFKTWIEADIAKFGKAVGSAGLAPQ